MQDLKL